MQNDLLKVKVRVSGQEINIEEVSKVITGVDEVIKELIQVKEKLKQEIENLEVVIDYISILEKNQFKPNTIKGSSLSKHQKERIIKGICKGLNDSEISRVEKVDRQAVKKIRTAGYKSPKTNTEILGIINHLLKVNQNPQFISQLKDLKLLYLSQ